MSIRLVSRHARLGFIAYRSLNTAVHRNVVLKSHGHLLSGLRKRDELMFMAVRCISSERSKVEATLKMLKDDLKQQEEENKRLKLVPVKEDAKKLTLKEKVVHELKHYYHGFRLLALETKLSAKYLWRIVRGRTLTRRERQQLVRTMSDLFRLVPFSIFIIVPFMEFALPIFLKLFPNMLPSTFQEAGKQEEKLRRQVKVKVEMAKFLQDTLEEIALERRSKTKSDKEESKALDFARFIKKVRAEGGYVSNEDLFKFTKLFEDELTLDNLSMAQLRALCRLLTIQPLGSPEILRFQLHLKLRELKADDKQIAAEGGVDALTTLDLQQACRARGMRAVGLSEQRLKEQLNQWLELSLSDKVPPSLLLLSRALYLPEDVPFSDRLKSLVQSLPEGIAEHTRQRLTEMEGGQVDHKARVDLIKKIEEAIQQEKALAAKAAKEKKAEAEMKKKAEEEAKLQVPSAESAEAVAAAAHATAAAAEAVQSAAADIEQAIREETIKVQDDVKAAIADVKKVAAAAEAVKIQAKEKEQAVDPKHLSTVEDILLGGPLNDAKHDIKGLKDQVSEHTEDLIKVNALDEAFAETKVAKRLRSKVDSMIKSVDHLVSKLEESKREIDETIADPAHPEQADIKRKKEVRVADVIERLKRIRNEDKDPEEAAKVEQLVKVLDEDTDGILDSDLVLEVIGLLEKHSDVSLSPSQLAGMIEVLKKEDRAEALTQALEGTHIDQPITPQDQSGVDVNGPSSSSLEPPSHIPPSVTSPLQQKEKPKGGTSKQSSV